MSATLTPFLPVLQDGELIVALFAGGGGASCGIEMALGRQVDIAVNHDQAAVEMHKANHPNTLHLRSDVFEVEPRTVTQGREVGFLWASPDCTYHSKARGQKPIRSANKKRRALAWVVTRWAGQVKPRVIMLENVEEFAQWGPLVGPPDKLRPCPRRRGRTFRKWVKSLTELGYTVEWRELRACDYGAPTIRKRLYLIARCDGQPIVWPKPTHTGVYSDLIRAEWQRFSLKEAIEDCSDPQVLPSLNQQLESIERKIADLSAKKAADPHLRDFRTAAECIDWSIPMLSIFATKEEAKAWGKHHGQAAPIRPLAENTNRRIARGVKRFVLESPNPYLVRIGQTGSNSDCINKTEEPLTTIVTKAEHCVVKPHVIHLTHEGDRRVHGLEEPAPTITGAQRGEQALVAPHVTKFRSGAVGNDMREPLATVTANSHSEDSNPGGSTPLGVVAPILGGVGGRAGQSPERSGDMPCGTVTSKADAAIIAPLMVPRYGEREGQEPRCRSVEGPSPVIVPSGNGGSLVAANLATYYGAKSDDDVRGQVLEDPLATQPTENRHALVASFLDQNNAGFYTGDGKPLDEPKSTVCASGSPQTLVAANLVEQHGTASAEDAEKPIGTLAAGGNHYGVMATHIQRDFGQSVGSDMAEPIGALTGTGNGKAGMVASFLTKFYGQGVGQEASEPIHTIPTLDRFGLVTVNIGGTEYVLEDIAMRMLQPHELYAAQGFPKHYIIDRGADDRKLTKTEQVRMCGNSVCPPVAAALVAANAGYLATVVSTEEGPRSWLDLSDEEREEMLWDARRERDDVDEAEEDLAVAA